MADFQGIISSVKQVSGVHGAAVVDTQGSVVVNEIPDAPADLGSVANALYGNISVQIKRMERGNLRRLVLETDNGITVISGISSGELLVVFINSVEGFNLPQLLEVVSRF